MINLIGYWASKDPDSEQYPDPIKMQDSEFWKTRDKDAVIAYLKNGYHCNHYRGFSGCRICHQTLGTHERTDGVWCWPDKLEHYIEKHNVILPDEFITHVAQAPKLLPCQIEAQLMVQGIQPHVQGDLRFFDFHPDETFWVEWGRKYRGETYEEMKARFKILAGDYERNTQFLSGGYGSAPEFGAIVAMGKEALPFVMRKIIDGGAWPWFQVMSAILGEGPPIEEKARGRLHLVYAKYLQWASHKGILPSEPL